MEMENLKRANKIVELVKMYSQKKKDLEVIQAQGVNDVKIESNYYHNEGKSTFRLEAKSSNDYNHDQPEGISTITDAYITTMLSLYNREIDNLEKEFNSL